MEFINYIKKIIEGSSKESSKRFMAIWTMCLITIVVFYSMLVEHVDNLTVLFYLLSFVGSLMAVSTIESVTTKKILKDKDTKLNNKEEDFDRSER